jgi:hypothetical protein
LGLCPFFGPLGTVSIAREKEYVQYYHRVEGKGAAEELRIG